jgi:hypothetical protein
VLLAHVAHGVGARIAAAHAHLHVLVVAEAGAAAAAEGVLADGIGRHLVEVVAAALQHVARLLQQAHGARGIAGVVVGHDVLVVAARVHLDLLVVQQVRGELADMHHARRACILEARAGDWRHGRLEKVRRAVHRIHVLVQHAPHVAALPAQYPLDTKALGLGINLGVQTLHRVVRTEQPEVAALRGVGAAREIQADFVEQHHVAEHRVVMRRREEVRGRHHEQDLGALAVDRDVDLQAGDVLELVAGELEAVLEGVRLDAEVVADAVGIGGRLEDPVGVAADEIQQLAHEHGDLRRIDPERTVDRTAPALGALVEVVEPFLDDVLGQLAAARQRAEQATAEREVAAIDRAHEFSARHRHVLRVAGAEVEVALVRAGAAAHADIHEQLEGAVLLQALPHAVEDDALPVGRQLPVQVGRLPLARIRQPERRQRLGVRRIAEGALAELDLRVEHRAGGRLEINLQLWVRHRPPCRAAGPRASACRRIRAPNPRSRAWAPGRSTG